MKPEVHMTENNNVTEQPLTNDFVKKFIEAENRYYQKVTIVKVRGECPYGHKQGEIYRVTNCNNDGLCGSLYKAMHSSIITLHYGGGLPWESNPDTYLSLCPEAGKVQVEVKRMKKKDFTFLKTKTQTINMTGKGFPGLDKYRVFIEIIDVAKECAWGHKAGQMFEVDPFNVGGVCGYLYSKAYDFINLYFAGGNLPWEMEENTIYSICPDSYNQTSFRLFRKERQ
jgi:uncharacterized repeat protein (TIGR04076 family)